jgi:MFS family permease
VQALDGIAAASFGIMVPLIVSDVAGGSGHFNLSLGAVGFGIGIGSTLSTPAAGWMADHFGTRLAFFALTAIGVAAVLAAYVMPETRPSRDAEEGASASEPAVDTTATQDPVSPDAAGAAPPPGDAAPPGDAQPKPPARRRA